MHWTEHVVSLAYILFGMAFAFLPASVYASWRDRLIMCVRLAVSLCSVFGADHWDPGVKWFGFKLIFNTSILTELYTSFGFSLPFTQHVLLQSVVQVLNFSYPRRRFCAQSLSADPLSAVTSQGDSSAALHKPLYDIIVDGTGSNGTKTPCPAMSQLGPWLKMALSLSHPYLSPACHPRMSYILKEELMTSCVGVCLSGVLLWQLVLGWFVPCVGVYVLEQRARHAFLMQRDEGYRNSSLAHRRQAEGMSLGSWLWWVSQRHGHLLLLPFVVLNLWETFLWLL